MSLRDKFKRSDVPEEESQNVGMTSSENLSKEERKALKKAKRSGFTETIEDDYDESDRTLADSEAHRDVIYTPPSTIKQIWICYMTQMKRFTKERTIWTLLLLLALIPVAYYVMSKALSVLGMETSGVINVFIAMPLIGMPIITMFICANVCGSMLPREYNERTVYFTLPLPLSRFAFYIGKFFAGVTLVWGVIAAAYGISVLLALFVGDADVAYSTPLFTSLMIILCGSFFFCAFVYMLSAASKRGAAMKSMLILIVGLPILVIAVNVMVNLESFASMKGILEPLCDVMMYLPILTPDLALAYLGVSPITLFIGIDWISLVAFVGGVAGELVPIELTMNAYVISVVSIVLGVLCLIRGFFKIRRRDM